MKAEEVTRFTTLWAQAQPSLSAFISSTITDFADAEDVLQKTAAAAVKKFDQYDPERPFLPWLIGIARFEILRHLRDSASGRLHYVSNVLPDIAAAFEDIAPELDDRRAALSSCLEHVRGRSRDVLQERYGQGKKTGAIAESLGLSPNNVSVILNRVYRSLRDCIQRRIAQEGNV
jgi:RNA polymerase sigma-70 factor (ECF subfamily)